MGERSSDQRDDLDETLLGLLSSGGEVGLRHLVSLMKQEADRLGLDLPEKLRTPSVGQ